jgi:hypothetical protein
MSEQLSDARLAQIKANHEAVPGSSLAKTQREISQAFFDRAWLLDEAERLRAILATNEHQLRAYEAAMASKDERLTEALQQLAAMREVVAAVAHAYLYQDGKLLQLTFGQRGDALQEKARALLGDDQP